MIKLKKRLIGTGLVLATGILLSACGQSNTDTSTYSSTFSANPTTFNYLLDYYADNTAVITNLVDGLLENDSYGNLVPALAEDWSVSADGLTYTYKLRKDAKWYTADGEEYAPVKAQDFVTGIKYAADNKGQAMDLIQNSIKGLNDYVTGATNDFTTVGVKALDDYTVEYTLTRPEPYWNSKTTNSILFPVNEEFLKSKDKDFGTLTPDSILYNGPYLLKDFTSKSSIEYVKNPHYYDHDKVTIEKVKLAYFDGSDQEMTIRNFESGAYSIAGVYPNSSNYAKTKEKYQDNIVYSLQDKTSWYFNFNVNRKTYNHTAKTTDEQKKSAQTAILNKNFRQAINFGIDRTAYSAQSNGEEAASKTLRNTLVPPTFVQVGDKTFGEVTASKLVNYGTEWSGINLADAQDAYFNKEKAQAKFAEAKKELEAQGVTFPIHLDVPVDQTNKNAVSGMNSVKQTLETVLGSDNIVIDVQQLSTDDFGNVAFLAPNPAARDYDLNFDGWVGDYQDPSTYLDPFNAETGFYLKIFGLDAKEDQELIKSLGLDTYTQLLKEADAENKDVAKRYEKYAEAQAWMIDNSLVMSAMSNGGTASVTKVTPFTRAYSLVGIKGDGNNYKYMRLQKDPVTKKQFDEAKAKWEEESKKAIEKSQKEFENHVK
ncbi:MAG: peptide ABC transporter substrate-binding protein [Streptococcus oralis]|jgi:oligopeptide transport system substrate-binding protein|uniref:peptide ABC transporter substrate-binding protein n=1 Tax=Streptococcus oralis TaxID=1303 RepID=UPI000C7E4C85|nr:peptide ABC transporter substrate-binding protein [Streptococcus oralis]MBA1351891.1 peptide ABC transporter substrate-binding protein [Streptococcus oralis subsp. oralis]MBK3297768.1 peptide ABC transporter substrate-binding protein [Streptococcus oralis]MDB6219672.1 peptide ABC transporter substrate-binding protein [Streptococcus oralis]MDK7119122.1 peptide ABC transporter substrate-binding protein [Streptococcus oralis]MDU3458403.1 peptide ABC transporter substrate-binding protein [Strep